MLYQIESEGAVEQRKELERLLMTDPSMEKEVQKLIRKVLFVVRKRIGEAAQNKSVMKADPRQAYKAVKTAVYRQLLGGNVSILSKRHAGSKFSAYEPPRKLTAGQRGGNRRKRSDRSADLLHYAGSDRGFVLRFLNAGTGNRNIKFKSDPNREEWPSVSKWNAHPNTGFRGNIAARNFFGPASQKAMENGVQELTNMIDQLIKEQIQQQ